MKMLILSLTDMNVRSVDLTKTLDSLLVCSRIESGGRCSSPASFWSIERSTRDYNEDKHSIAQISIFRSMSMLKVGTVVD
jgi:hypothetical protein